ncbi:MAG: nicotinate-nucleotide--dimethylbenzimidazole phosphoribosyltransferase [Gemmatimonadales bacterium]|nr:MAG: nicotinate-nucleotide--dimethylbenzimidazole phosphoribosyltransferase [Gemmatimonadales bacterium]
MTAAQAVGAEQSVGDPARIRAHLDNLTKPPGSLGHLEELALRLGTLLGDPPPPLSPRCVLVMAGDHGVTRRGVSAYPSQVTQLMCRNMAAGGAAINALAGSVDARVVVVDLGVDAGEPLGEGILHRRIRRGTRDLSREPALTDDEVDRALEAGARVLEELSPRPAVLVLGEMGIGNTTSASALAAALLRCPAVEMVGPGTGIPPEAQQEKVRVVEAGLRRIRNGGAGQDHASLARRALAEVGGLEIAGLVGAALAARRLRIPVVLDGFISSVAGLVAKHLNPHLGPWLFASHRSAEPGHDRVLDGLGLRPLLDLGFRLGEGTGGVLALPILEGAGAILREMATFESAGIPGPAEGDSAP